MTESARRLDRRLDRTHEATARSWVVSANAGSDFPIQNLPFGVFRVRGSGAAFRGGVAIGTEIVDLGALAGHVGVVAGAALVWPETAGRALDACTAPALNAFFDLGPLAWRGLRHALFDALREDAPAETRAIVERCLVSQRDGEFAVPATIGDYTDFYTSIDHALNVGRLFRPDAPLAPNFKSMPIAYHGRVSSIGVSGAPVRRPKGQWLRSSSNTPVYEPSERLDYEMELGFFIGTGNAQGEPIPLASAADHVFGLCLLNDWSARDIQRWESTPLGPFLAKNFATTVSPWIVTMDALQPYRTAVPKRPDTLPTLPHLSDAGDREEGAFDIRAEVSLSTPRLAAQGLPAKHLSATSFRHQYWTMAQMVAHHTAGGCNLRSGDLLGSGTISGPTPDEAGSMLELSQGGARPLLLGNGEERRFLEDGDTVIMRGSCEQPGFVRIGFGEARGTIVAA
jgi:fumarylacetoacetase